MSDQPDQNINEQRPIAFCQNCGTSLTSETVRRVGPAVYCEPCLEARLAGAPPIPGSAQSTAGPAPGYGPVNVGGPIGVPINGFPAPAGVPNPGLAALLGLIPGVGAMYNEQYAKGIVHLLIFAVLTSFSHISGVFGLFAFGWICYMSIEAHHTARARRDGSPLPNPFGLNDIGERMGFGRAWPNGPDVAGAARDAVDAAAAGIGAATAGFGRNAPPTPPPGAATGPATGPAAGQPVYGANPPPWGAPSDVYPPSATSDPASWQNYGQNYGQPFTPNYSQTYPPVNPVPPYNATYVPPVTVPPLNGVPPGMAPRNRFPAGAIWLITLGMVFLLGTLGIFNAVPGSALLGVTLLVLGVWIFLHRMMDSGQTLAYDGSPVYHLRVLRALRGSVWLMALGILSLLDSFRLVRWYASWPWFIILAGVMMLMQRTAYNSAAAAAAYGPPIPPIPTTPAEPKATPPAGFDTHEGGN